MQMSTTAELRWIFSNLCLSVPGVATCFLQVDVHLFCRAGASCTGADVFHEFQLLLLSSRASLQCEGRGQEPCRNHNCFFYPLVKLQLLDHPLQLRACACNPCAHAGVSACVSANMYVSHLPLPLSGTSFCGDFFALRKCTCWSKTFTPIIGSIQFLIFFFILLY